MYCQYMNYSAALRELAQYFNEATNIVVLTGAGMSTESGIADFRSPDGIWSKYDIMEYGTIEAFYRNPKKVWEFFIELYEGAKDKQPNQGHYYLAKLEMINKETKNGQFTVVTQNIDGFHQAAGSSHVLELHGNGKEVICVKCKAIYPFESINLNELPPKCPKCGGIVKVNAILFGEPLPTDVFNKAEKAIKESDLLLVLGTSLEVYPANTLAFLSKGKTALINLSSTRYDYLFDVVIHERISVALDKLLGIIETNMK